ncbi:alpha-hydroxy acid oxidase [Aspergillus melleus]|uniref:alpha-hydroxy acid oxidase n=1 Tax=Aspergillus melleus TaxID=138277 RepID=UPI001E8DB78A|nr:uncharacterized protein LDX57_010482 [Aspergillus melleus]KAH8432852.1 hypothetical protein LDX57_010482 [Aspergillus melleus]
MANRPPALDKHVFCIKDLREAGNKKLPKAYRDFHDDGSMDMLTLKENESAFDHYKIRPRVMVNVDDIDTSTTLFGSKVSFPLGFSPTGMQKLAHPDGELATSRAAASTNLGMILSSYSTVSMEEVIEQGQENPYAIQMCILRDRSFALKLLRRAEAAGYKAFFLSVDFPLIGQRLNESRNEFVLPEHMSWPNLNFGGDSFFGGGGGTSYDSSIEWREFIPWLRENTTLPIWLKGITTKEDVELAIEYGADGVVISNHGGRQLDGAPAAIDALRECEPIARGKIQIALEGGIRRGSDIFKALALGAQHCFVGRVPIWGLAYDGQNGVELAMKLLHRELKTTMALAGCRTIDDIRRSHISVLQADRVLARL